ncbi:MAG TPA: HipA domain-containing protein [Kofleriaceae bacterium]|nr:HipA domain-containing protein [Kofleriaceae bacterium]
MERGLDVFVDLAGTPVLVGRLWTRSRGTRDSSSFEYDPTWLARADRFAIDPELTLVRGPMHSPRPLWNAFTDPAPDRWGQTLLRRHEIARARREGRAPRTLLPIDFLTLVDDETRLGALRFRAPGSTPWLASDGRKVPPLVELGRLLAATTRLIDERESEDDLRLLLAPGTSLGGARPKASIRDAGGHLAIAKFPRKDDAWPVTRWEAVALALARSAGIDVPAARLELVARRPVLIVRRFDRRGAIRVPFISALTALATDDGEPHSYLELAALLRQHSPEARRDLAQLWRRIVFNVLVSNTDDHLRNHGFVRSGDGWSLAPAYDLNPVPVDVRPRIHALALDADDANASIELVRSIAPQFGLVSAEAVGIMREVARAVSHWRAVGARHGLTAAQLDRMASAFDHANLRAARAG